jgi:high-affinity iron transporter
MLASYVITLREGIEAALIIAIILSYLAKVGAKQLARPVYYGAILGILASAAVGAAFLLLSVEFEGRFEEVFEGATMFLAAAILSYAILWMRENSRAYSESLTRKVQKAVTEKQIIGLATLAFVSIFREGVETVLFLGSASFTSEGPQIIVGGAAGLATAVIVAIAIMKFSVKLDLRTFFRATSMVLVLFAAGLVAHGIGEFQEAGLISPLVGQMWDTGAIVSEDGVLGEMLTALFGYTATPSLAQLLGYFGYLTFVVFWVFRETTFLVLRRAYAAIRPT